MLNSASLVFRQFAENHPPRFRAWCSSLLIVSKCHKCWIAGLLSQNISIRGRLPQSSDSCRPKITERRPKDKNLQPAEHQRTYNFSPVHPTSRVCSLLKTGFGLFSFSGTDTNEPLNELYCHLPPLRGHARFPQLFESYAVSGQLA